MPLFRYLGGEQANTLPVPMMNVINGGAHATNSIDLQEFMVVPVGADSFADGLRIGAEVYHALKEVLTERGLATGVGDEGGFAPDLESSEAAIDAILEAAESAGHRDRVAIALDPAASEVFADGVYRFEGREKSSAEMPGFWAEIVERYPGRLDRGRRGGGRLGVVGGADRSCSATGCSSSATTSSSRTRNACSRGSSGGSANSILVKVNQIGTLTETIDAVRLAQSQRLHGRDVASLRRDRGRDHRGSRGRARHRADQDRRACPLGPRREVQPAAADRGAAGSSGEVSRLGRFPALPAVIGFC